MTADSSIVVSSLERTLPLTVSVAEVEAQALKRLQKMGRTVKMPGFRPGKVPMRVVQQTYGAQAQSEAIGDVINRVYSEAIVSQKLRPAGPPDIRPVQGAANESEPTELKFEAVVEVYPEIAVPERSGLQVTRWKCEPQAADTDRTLETLRKQRVEYKTVDRAAQAEDQVRVDFSGSLNGEAFEGGSAKDFRLIVMAGQMLPEFDAAMVGMKAGDTKTFPLTFPADYRAELLAGKTGEFSVTVHEVLAPALPALDDSLAEAFGIKQGGLAKLREDVEKNLRREVASRCKSKTKQSVMDALLASAFFDVPKALIDSEAQRMADQMRHQMEAEGMQVKGLPFSADLFKDQAAKRVRLGLMVGEVIKSKQLQANEVQLRVMLGEIAESYEKPEEFIKWTLGDAQRRAEAEALVVEDNVVNWVLESAKVEDKTVGVEELMKEANQE